jgi:hypothetical protein
MSVILDLMRTLLATRQKEGESLQDYTKRFWITQEVFKSHLRGPIILTKILSNTTGYKKETLNEIQKEKNTMLEEQAFEQLLAFNYLENADQSKYRSILSGLNTQQSLGNDQYPKSIGEANNVLSNHHFDAIKQGTKFFNKNWTNNSKKKPEQEKISLSFAQMEGKCYCCGKPGHKSPQCWFNKKPKSEWSINKTQQSHAQTSKQLENPKQVSDKQSIGNTKNVSHQTKKEG